MRSSLIKFLIKPERKNLLQMLSLKQNLNFEDFNNSMILRTTKRIVIEAVEMEYFELVLLAMMKKRVWVSHLKIDKHKYASIGLTKKFQRQLKNYEKETNKVSPFER